MPVVTTGSGVSYWSDPNAWSGPTITLQGSAGLTSVVNGGAEPTTSRGVHGSIGSIANSGPSAQSVSIATNAGWNDNRSVDFSVPLSLAYDAQIASGVTMIMDQPNVALDALTVDQGGALTAGSRGFLIQNDVWN